MNNTLTTPKSKAMIIGANTIGINNDPFTIVMFARFIAAAKMVFPTFTYYKHTSEADHTGLLVTFDNINEAGMQFLVEGSVAFINHTK